MFNLPQIADKTLALIEETIEKDQGASFREWEKEFLPKMDDAYAGHGSPFRKHLGASLIGRKCVRSLWYSFRWFKKPHFNARILRLFNRGHLEEARFLAMLKSAGIQVWFEDDSGKQFSIKGHKGHFGGSLDGIVLGLPEIPEHPALAEFKTHSEKSFTKLKKEGVRLAKPEHFTQMQVYMDAYSLHYGLYVAVNKNNDEIYTEIITADKAVSSNALAKAELIIDSVFVPERLNHASPGLFDCKYCDYLDICHKGAEPEMNCRTCQHSNVLINGEWECSNNQRDPFGDSVKLDENDQLAGCNHYQPLDDIPF